MLAMRTSNAAWQSVRPIEPANSVAHKQPGRPAAGADLEKLRPTMARCVMRPRLVAAEGDHLTVGVEVVDRRLRFNREAEHRAVLHRLLVEKEIVL